MKRNNMSILSHLRANARMKLTDISKGTGIPVSTIHDRLRTRFEGAVTKMSVLLDFRSLGFTARAVIILKVDREQRENVRSFLAESHVVNNLFKINNGFDFMIDGVFRTLMDLEIFVEGLEERFCIRDKQIYYIIEDLEREKFMSSESLMQPAQTLVQR